MPPAVLAEYRTYVPICFYFRSWGKADPKGFYDSGAHRDFLKTVFPEQDEVKKVFKTVEPLHAFWFEESEIEEAEREDLSLQAPVMKWIPAGFEL